MRTTTRHAGSAASPSARRGARRSASAFMAFNRSGRSRVIRVTPSCGWSTCTVSTAGPLRSARPYPATDGGQRARRDGSRTWGCGTRASSTLRCPRSSPGTNGRGQWCASCRPGSRSRWPRKHPHWPMGGRSCGCPGACPGWLSIPTTIRRTDSSMSWCHCPCTGATPTRSSAVDGARTKVTDSVETPVPGLVPPPDVPVPAPPTGRRPGCAPAPAALRTGAC